MKNNKNIMRYDISLTDTQKKIINIFIREELNFYNTLNDKLKFQLRNNHEGFLELQKKLRLFGEIIEHSISLRNMDDKIPEQLMPIQEDIKYLSERALKVLDTGLIKTQISPRMKRNIGVQLFKYYSHQATAFNAQGTLRVPITMLENYDLIKKRHVQLHRKTLIVDYNDDNNITFIHTPYLKNPLYIKENLKKLRWNILIIHQKPHEMASQSSPWCIDLKDVDEDYILKYLDNPKPKSILNHKDYRKVSF